jgi:CheY-like chemotaxis protein
MSEAATILIIEDNPDVADSMAVLLEMEGYRAVVARDGIAGVDAARSERPAAILCDIGLPGLSGYEVASLLRSEAGFQSVAMLAITGYAQYSDRQQALGVGFDEHMAKPVDASKVLAFLAGAVGQRGDTGSC